MFDDVVLMKLTLNVDCMGKLVGEDSDLLRLAKMRVLVYQSQGSNQVNIGFQPFFLPAEDEEIEMSRQHVVCMVKPPERILRGYIQAVSSIQLASQMPAPNSKM